MSSPADRQRRYRERKKRHDAGDHGMCLPGKCSAVEPGRASEPVSDTETGVTGDVTDDVRSPVTKRPPPAGLGVRGVSLWERMSGRDFGPMHLGCLEEACRAADAIDGLTSLLEGGELVEVVRSESESSNSVVEVRVVVNGLLAERRQQQEVFRRMTAELRLSGRAGAGSAGESSTPRSSAAGVTAGEEGIGDLIDAAGRFTSQG